MARKRATVNVGGMNRDMAKSLFDPKFTFENMNIRVTARDDANTALAVTNEKGTRLLDVPVYGTPVGSFTCDSFLGLFSYDEDKDYITVYKKDGKELSEYFRWSGPGLGFKECDPKSHRIETEVSVESGDSVRVYWVDGVHQPRVVDFKRLRDSYGEVCSSDKVDADYFGFLPVVRDIKGFVVTKGSSGYFYSGTVQFVVTEVVNGNESNIAHYSPLYYASDDANNRGYKPDNQSSGCSFTVSFGCGDDKVDYFIIYAIYRSSQNGAAQVFKREAAYSESVSVAFVGDEEAVDKGHVLFLNRQPMVGARTIKQKDGVLFIGGWEGDESDTKKEGTATVEINRSGKTLPLATFSDAGCSYESQLKLSSFDIGHFKLGEGYLLGYQVMDRYGRWGSPRFLRGGGTGLHKMTAAPMTLFENGSPVKLQLPVFTAQVTDEPDAVKIRPVVAYLDTAQKPCLYQGIVTPAIYCEKERVEGSCYAKLSPFTRPFRHWEDFSPHKLWSNPRFVVTSAGVQKMSGDVYTNYVDKVVHSYLGYNPTAIDAGVQERASMAYGTYPASQHLQALGTTKDYNNEMQSAWRYREVAYKTALLPNVNRKPETSGSANAIREYDVTFNISSFTFLSSGANTGQWVEKFFVGKGKNDGKIYLYSIKNQWPISDYSESLAKSLSDNDSDAETIMDYILWGVEDEKKEDKKEDKSKYPDGFPKAIICDMAEAGEKGGTYSASQLGIAMSGVYGSGYSAIANAEHRWFRQTFDQSRYEAKLSEMAGYYDADLATGLEKLFGPYSTMSANSADDENANDVFTIDNTSYFVDAATLTLHSPDITDATSVSNTGGKLRVVGSASMDGFVSDTQIVAQAAKLSEKMGGTPGFQGIRPSSTEGGRCAMNLPNWMSTWDAECVERQQLWAVPPFGVSDFLAPENNLRKTENRKTGELTYHQLSNYRYCGNTSYWDWAKTQEIKAKGIESVNGSEVDMRALGSDKVLYKAAEDTELIPSLAFFWSNGPYYTEDNRPKDKVAAGLFNVGKWNNWRAGSIWQQLVYACTWLKDADAQRLLDMNLVTLITETSVARRQKNRGYWHNGGTVDEDKMTLKAEDGSKLKGQKMNYCDDYFVETAMNEYNGEGVALDSYNINWDCANGGFWDEDDDPRTFTTPLRYRSTPHAVIALDSPMWDYSQLATAAIGIGVKYGSMGWKKQNAIGEVSTDGWKNDVVPPSGSGKDCLWVVDIVNNEDEPSVDPATAQWMIAGEAVDVKDGRARITWKQGDWYYQRYECLRTYPQSTEEKSQVVEIVSFMCETRRNIDGRYDSHGGKAFLQANPGNYFKINDSYTQQNNFFSYAMPGENDHVSTSYLSSLTWSLPKTLNANVDAWTSITGASVLDLDGDKGPVTTLARFANGLLCFQPSGISRVLYNERTPLSTEDGVPVELGMSGKVDGKQYIANAMGALYNTNVVSTDAGVYFLDSYNTMLCAISESVMPLSERLGFHSWVAGLPLPCSIRMYHDRRNGCVMAVNDDTALAFNERAGSFESFFSYEGTAEVANVQDMTVLLHTDADGRYRLWELNGGDYNVFFGEARDYWVDMLIAGTPTDKVFDNVEFRGDLLSADGGLTPKRCPFNAIRAYNEYQDSGEKPLRFDQYAVSPLKNRFRSWHAYVPRNAERRLGRLMERIRNPWAHIILLMRQPEGEEKETGRAQIQELNVDYTE